MEHLGQHHTMIHRDPADAGIVGNDRDVQVPVSLYRFVYVHHRNPFTTGLAATYSFR